MTHETLFVEKAQQLSRTHVACAGNNRRRGISTRLAETGFTERVDSGRPRVVCHRSSQGDIVLQHAPR